MRAFLIAISISAATVALAALVSPGHAINCTYAQVIRAAQGANGPAWKDADKGDVTGDIKYTGKKPTQPMVLYLVRDGEQGTFDVPAELSVSQKGAVFNPSFACLVVGQKVTFKNDEEKEIDHNVYFLGSSNVDLEIIAQKQSKSHTFDAAGEVTLHCSIHKFMDGKFFIAPNPAFAKVEGDATSYSIKGVPVGKYKLKTWQKSKRYKDVELPVEVTKGAETKLDVEMTR